MRSVPAATSVRSPFTAESIKHFAAQFDPQAFIPDEKGRNCRSGALARPGWRTSGRRAFKVFMKTPTAAPDVEAVGGEKIAAQYASTEFEARTSRKRSG
jgi:hypothetical protein